MRRQPLFRATRTRWRRGSNLPLSAEILEDRFLLAAGFSQVNLASNVPGLAQVTNTSLVNPWGLAYSPTGPFWLANNGSGVSDLLNGLGQPLSLAVTIPSSTGGLGTPTGVVFNSGTGFAISGNGATAPATFLFATQDGKIAGWSDVVDPTHAVVAVDNSASGADYTGLAIGTNEAGQTLLYAADFARGTIDVFDQNFKPVSLPGSFQDPNLPSGFAPFNVAEFNNQIYVTYARRADATGDNASGPGLGYIDVFDTSGNLVKRLASQGALDSPWGMAIAPAGFGPYGGDLLVGNNGDGRINIFNPTSGAYLGVLKDDQGNPIEIQNLWSLTFGNGHLGGDSETLFFTAGLNQEQQGLFGAIQAPGRQGADTEGPGGFNPNAPGEAKNYPLPPVGGPALLSSTDGQSVATSDLLPLEDSSLVLVPTLLSPSQTGSVNSASVQDNSTVDSASNATLVAAPGDTNVLSRLIAEAESQAASMSVDNSITLNQFLNIEVQAAAIPKPAEQQTSAVEQPRGKLQHMQPAGVDAGIDVSALDAFFQSVVSSAALPFADSP
jgi:uncharacterized protein (TIGR03118 family)